MSVNDSLSSMILTDANIIAYIYNIVKESASEAVSLKTVTSSKNQVNIIRPGIEGVNRATTDCRGSGGAPKDFRSCRHSNAYSIEYNPVDLMIVGGSALNIYDHLLKELKERREINALETYLKKKTSDIDIVWWPRPSTDKEIIVSSSMAIQNVVIAFKEQLVKNFAAKKDEINEKLRPYIKEASLEINVKLFHVFVAGVWSVNIEFIVEGVAEALKICDISVHDSGSSQLYDMDGNKIKELLFMTADPIYCNPRQGHRNSISYLVIDDLYVAVPNIQSFVTQQLLAFSNLIRRGEVKAFINYKRVEFIKKLLQNIVVNSSNTRNRKELIEVFKTDNPSYPQQVVEEIDEYEKQSIYKLREKILSLCPKNTEDELISQLYKRATVNENAVKDSYIRGISDEIEKIKARLRGKSTDKETTSQIRREYDELFRTADNLRVRLIRSSPMEIVTISEGADPLQPILEREGEMDKVVQKLFADRKAEANRRQAEAEAKRKADVAAHQRRLDEDRRRAAEQQRYEEEQYRASMAATSAPRNSRQFHIVHHPAGTPLPSGMSWVPAPIVPLPRNGPPPQVFVDPATGQKWYPHPTTGQIIVQGPDGRWYPRDLPPISMSFQPPRQGPYRGKGVGTRKNRKTNNTTLKH